MPRSPPPPQLTWRHPFIERLKLGALPDQDAQLALAARLWENIARARARGEPLTPDAWLNPDTGRTSAERDGAFRVPIYPGDVVQFPVALSPYLLTHDVVYVGDHHGIAMEVLPRNRAGESDVVLRRLDAKPIRNWRRVAADIDDATRAERIRRALSTIGRLRYVHASSNCQHVAALWLGINPTSVGVRRTLTAIMCALVALLVVAACIVVLRRRRQRITGASSRTVFRASRF